jgi:hypothetical protein
VIRYGFNASTEAILPLLRVGEVQSRPRYGYPSVWLRSIGLERRTSAAKAVKRQAIYGTAEAVPFVKILFTMWLNLTNG